MLLGGLEALDRLCDAEDLLTQGLCAGQLGSSETASAHARHFEAWSSARGRGQTCAAGLAAVLARKSSAAATPETRESVQALHAQMRAVASSGEDADCAPPAALDAALEEARRLSDRGQLLAATVSLAQAQRRANALLGKQGGEAPTPASGPPPECAAAVFKMCVLRRHLEILWRLGAAFDDLVMMSEAHAAFREALHVVSVV